MPQSKSTVSLTEGERNDLRGLLKNGILPVRTVIRALVLLRLDEGVKINWTFSRLDAANVFHQQLQLFKRSRH
jgi:hypothetical protein